MRTQGQAVIAVAVVVAAFTAAGCSSARAGSSGSPGRRAEPAPVAIESPTYLPAALPGGFGAYPVRFRGREPAGTS